MLRMAVRAVLLLVLIPVPRPSWAQEPVEDPLAAEVDRQVTALGDESFAVRERAYRRLLLMGPRALPRLRRHADSDDPEVARLVAQLIGTFAQRARDELLAPLGTEQNDFESTPEFEAIVSAGRKILPDLFAILDEEDRFFPSFSYWRLRNAWLVIGRLVTDEDLERLIDRLDHPNVHHRLLLRQILPRLDGEKVVQRFRARLKDPAGSAQLRANVLDLAFGWDRAMSDPEFGELARGLVTDDAPLVRIAALKWFTQNSDPPEPVLAAVKDEDPAVRAAAVRALRNSRQPEIIAILISALGDPAAEVRAAALDTMRGRATPDLAPTLRKYLKDPDPRVRSSAAQNLGRLGDRGAVPVLLELLKERDEQFLTSALHSVLSAIGQLGDPSALDPLYALLEDAKENATIANYRYRILTSILEVGGADVLDRIRPHLADPDFPNRSIVLDVVGRLDSEKVVPILLDALKSGDSRLEASAIRGLSARDLTAEQRKAACPLILAAMDGEEDAWILSEAVQALTVFGYEPVIPEVGKLLATDATDDRRVGLFYALIRAAMRFGLADAAPRIAELALGRRNYRYLGVDCLGRLGNGKAAPVLEKMLASEENDAVRRRIELALARVGKKEPLATRVADIGEPENLPELSAVSEMLVALGRRTEALAALDRLLDEGGENGTYVYNAACGLAQLGEKERALRALDRSIELRKFNRRQLLTDPDLFPLHDDARFAEILRRAN